MFRAQLDRTQKQPAYGLALLIAAQFALWSLAPAMSHSAPPLDVVEMYAWGREGVVATFKHPNLPGLILEGIRRVTGQAGWPAYLVSQICIGVTFWAVFTLGRELLDARRALAGTLMLTGVYFFSWPSPEFNHNVAQMPLWALTSLLFWRAATRDNLLNWALLGAIAGLSLWAKYSSMMLLAPVAIWLLWDAEARRKLLSPGPYIALAAFLLVAAPQALWLTQNQFAPLSYAAERSGGGGFLPTLEFLALEIANHLPLVLLLAFTGWLGRPSAEAPEAPSRRALHFLLLIGLGPLALTALVGVLGSGLRTSWGAPMFNLSGLIIAALLSNKLSASRLNRLAIGAGALLIVLPSLYFIHMRFGAGFTGKPLKGNWPQTELTAALEDKWRTQTSSAPLRIVSGDIWTAGLVGMKDAKPPSVLIDGDMRKSPWVTQSELRQKGAVVVWRQGDSAPAPFRDLAQSKATTLSIPFKNFPDIPPLQLHYMIVEPEAD
jgi:hypothetical protein